MTKLQKDLSLLKVFLMAGAFTFSGGMAMLPVIQKELVAKKQMITEEDLYEYAAIAQTLPGVIALSTACFVGKKCNGNRGLVVAGIGAILPAYILMTLATILYQYLPGSGPVVMALTGIRATCSVFVLAAAISIIKYHVKSIFTWGIASFCFVTISFLGMSAPIVMIISAVLGVLVGTAKNNKAGEPK